MTSICEGFSFSPQNKALNSNQNKVHIWYHIDSILYCETLCQKWFGERGLGHNNSQQVQTVELWIISTASAWWSSYWQNWQVYLPSSTLPVKQSNRFNTTQLFHGPRSLNLSDSLTGGDFCDGFLSTKFFGPPVGLVVRWKTTSGMGQIKAELSNNMDNTHDIHWNQNMTLLVSRIIIARQGQPQKICWQLWGLRGPWLNLMPNRLRYPKKNVRGYYVGAKSSHKDFLTKLMLCRGCSEW